MSGGKVHRPGSAQELKRLKRWSKHHRCPEGPSQPVNVTIRRHPHTIRVEWDVPLDQFDPDIIDRRVEHYYAELYRITPDDPDIDNPPFDEDHFVIQARWIHILHHAFRVEPDNDTDYFFYARVQAWAKGCIGGEFVPATLAGNDDPDAVPDVTHPLWHEAPFTFTIPGTVKERTYFIPERVHDDFMVNRVSVAAHQPGRGGATRFDIKINAGPYVFDLDNSREVSMAAGDHHGFTKHPINGLLRRGDFIRVRCTSAPPHPPAGVTVKVICHPYFAPIESDELGSYDDSSDGGGSIVLTDNDAFADAIELFDAFDTGLGDNTGYSKESGEIDLGVDNGGASAWWVWTCPADGDYTLDTIGSDFDTILGVVTGSSVGSLTEVASDDDGAAPQSQLTFTATEDTVYHFVVDGFSGATGSIVLNLAPA